MFKQRYLVFKYQWISLILGQRSALGPVWRAGDRPLPGWWKQPSCLMLLLLTTLLRVKVNMKARGVSQIFALWLILMYIHVYSNFQVYPELVPTGHKWTNSKISKSNTGTGASFFTTISEPLNGAQAFLFFSCFSSLSPILSPSVEEEETFFLSTPWKCPFSQS